MVKSLPGAFKMKFFNRKERGSGLIELLIVLAIVAALLVVAIPSYQQHTTRTHRTDGQTALLDLAHRMERYYAIHQTYATASIASGNVEHDVLENTHSPQGWYQLAIDQQDNASYHLRAIPKKRQATADTLCQTLTLNYLGEKGITSGPAGEPNGDQALCW